MSNRYQQRGPSLHTPKHKLRNRRHTPSSFHILFENVDNLNSLIKDRFWELGQATKILVDQIRDLQSQLTAEKHSFNVLLSLITSLGKAATGSAHGHAPPQRKSSNEPLNSLHTSLRAGLKRSRAQSNNSPEESERYIHGDSVDGSSWDKIVFCQFPPFQRLASPLTIYSNALDDANGEESQLYVRPRSPHFMHKYEYFLEEYDRKNQHWTFIRDRRSTEAGKREAAYLLEVGWRDCGTFQADLEDCARMTDTTFEFKVWAEYFDVPYSGDDNVLTPNDPGYPSRLRTRPPPLPSSSSEWSDESWHGIQAKDHIDSHKAAKPFECTSSNLRAFSPQASTPFLSSQRYKFQPRSGTAYWGANSGVNDY
ncbi:hypothetical protein D9613_010315 [Agrocybe pediades]|uniref:Uncharacterized protein n=1 Tax=Agrocybe pediades TaxID=84607 RepID=A0A8H4QFG4_9AGAR|nr:hypothetical protein D9613_010315 [Agrocybe pediades]